MAVNKWAQKSVANKQRLWYTKAVEKPE